METIVLIMACGLAIYVFGSLIQSIYELFKTISSIEQIKEVENKLHALLECKDIEYEEFEIQLDKLLKELNEIK